MFLLCDGTGPFTSESDDGASMSRLEFADRLEPLGVAVGALLVLMGLGTLVGAPWATNDSGLATVIQLVGIALTVAIGVALARLSYVG